MSTDTIYVNIPGRSFSIDATVQSTSISSGALVSAGGLGFEKDAYIGGNVYLSNTLLNNVGGVGTTGSLGNMIYHNGTKYVQLTGGLNTRVLQINSSIPGWVSSLSVGITSHGDLSGLNADDHTQYLLINGSRAMTGELDMNFNNFDNVGGFAGVAGALGDIPIRNATEYTRLAGGTNNQLLSIVSSVPTWISQSAISHSSLGNLTVDSHTQYMLHNGSRAMTGQLDMNGRNFDNVSGFAGLSGALGDIPRRTALEYVRLGGGTNNQIMSIVASVPTWTSIQHSLVGNLTSDDHTMYLLVNGSRAMTGNLTMNGTRLDNVGGFAGVTGSLGDTIYHNGTEYTKISGGAANQVYEIISSVPTWVNQSQIQTPWMSNIDAANFRLIDINKIGTNTISATTGSIAIGVDANSSAADFDLVSISIGLGSYSTLSGIGIGSYSDADSAESSIIAIGSSAATSTEFGCIAIGTRSFATDISDSVAIGNNAKNTFKCAIGDFAEADVGFAIGTNAFATQNGAAIGTNAIARAGDAVGTNAESAHVGAFAIGRNSFASGDGATALGYYARAINLGTIALGMSCSSIGIESICVGSRSNVSGDGTIVIGYDTFAGASNAIAIGYRLSNTVASTFIIDASTASSRNSRAMLSGSATGTFMNKGCIERSSSTSKSASATLTADEIKAGTTLIYSGSTASQTLTLPTGTSIDSNYVHLSTSNFGESFNVYFRNTASVSVTITQNTGSTIVHSTGSPTTFVTNSSGLLRFVRTAANTWSVYIWTGLDI